jgi:hypothetical protein
MPPSVIFAIINPCIYLEGSPSTNLENKTLLCFIVEKLQVFVINHQKDGD